MADDGDDSDVDGMEEQLRLMQEQMRIMQEKLKQKKKKENSDPVRLKIKDFVSNNSLLVLKEELSR